MTYFQKYLEFLSLENQICEIDSTIHDFNKSNPEGENFSKTFRIINELKKLNKKIILNHEEYLCEKYLN